MEVPIIQLQSLDELGKELDRFHSNTDSWYFRGQANSSWELLPSVWRNNPPLFKLFCEKIKKNSTVELQNAIQDQIKHMPHCAKIDLNNAVRWVIQTKYENFLLSKFYYEANRAGLNVDAVTLNRCTIYNQDFWLNNQKLKGTSPTFQFYEAYCTGIHHRVYSPIVFDSALPQHYGLPTRHLDWTKNPRIAAFFAAHSYQKMPASVKENIHEIAIYAIREKPGQVGPVMLKKHHLNHMNPFLHAQAGLFSYTHGDCYFLDHNKWPSIDKLYTIHGDKFFEIKKYILDVKFIDELTERLYKAGISASTLMPSYSHVASQVINDFLFLQ